MNPHFKRLVRATRAQGAGDRPLQSHHSRRAGFEDMAAFLAEHQVEIVASLPCYQEDNVDRQRGKGTFDASIRALHRLNALGYGDTTGSLLLNLVLQPAGPVLPPPQESLGEAYKAHLADEFDVRFNNLF